MFINTYMPFYLGASYMHGIIQNDVRNTHIYTPEFSMKLIEDIFELTSHSKHAFVHISGTDPENLEGGWLGIASRGSGGMLPLKNNIRCIPDGEFWEGVYTSTQSIPFIMPKQTTLSYKKDVFTQYSFW